MSDNRIDGVKSVNTNIEVKELPRREKEDKVINKDVVVADKDVIEDGTTTTTKNVTSEERFAAALARIEKLETALTHTQAKLQEVEGELATAKSDLTTKVDAKVYAEAEDKRIKEERKEGWLGRVLTDIMKIFARIFSPMFSVVSLGFRLLKLAWTGLIKREKIDWKAEGPRLLADAVGAAVGLGGFMAAGPFGASWGGIASAAVHTYLDIKDEDGDKKQSGISVAFEKAKDFLTGAKDDVVGVITGKKPAEGKAVDESGIETGKTIPTTKTVEV